MIRSGGAAMPRVASWIAASVVAVLLVVAATGRSAYANEQVAYYTVAPSHQGKPENLRDIATRLLGDGERWDEVYNLNVGRSQPAGQALTNPDSLRAGWYLVMPWDAAGPGVRYGVLPTEPPPSPAPVTGNPTTSPPRPAAPGSPTRPAPSAGSAQSGGPAQSASPRPSASPSVGPALAGVPPNPGQVPSAPPPPADEGECVAATAASEPSDWGMVRIAADLAWPHSRGHGQLVAIVDSGVDGRSEQLSGRVAIGANIVTGDGRGDVDCLGTGTAMAGLVAAEPATKEETFTGVAPESVVMPVRIVTDEATADPALQATAIEVAVSTGANVIALGAHVDIAADLVAKAVATALSHDIVVVAGAPASGKTGGTATVPAGTIVVGGIGVDGMTAEEYVPGSVDVVAPGVNITTIGANGAPSFTGSGTQYAVAVVAGVAALVRSSHPGLSAAQVAHRVAVTADRMGDAEPDPRYGYGMVNPEAAIVRVLSEEVTPISSGGPAGGAGDSEAVRIAFLLTLLAAFVLTGLLVIRLRRTMRQSPEDGEGLDAQWPQGQPVEPTVATSP
ncbi:S8 family serine peptidase [Micromonospora sp. NBC_01813]|uniref:S8 family serine peptidase n=1 Tax=Micromonospora sp. NBC_01813 TaxID=2975988 RepID=UPI002DDA6C9F|nr:S8 family serine peptidase [Micromonospora sp. NBC_01813]WSA07725.1 S8 family serine peptidase [Micromonospora sp. NBC_01813]